MIKFSIEYYIFCNEFKKFLILKKKISTFIKNLYNVITLRFNIKSPLPISNNILRDILNTKNYILHAFFFSPFNKNLLMERILEKLFNVCKFSTPSFICFSTLQSYFHRLKLR